MSPLSPNPRVLRFGVFEADFKIGELRKNGLRIKVQDQPFQVLAMLLEKPGGIVTREELQRRLWPADTFVDFDHSLNSAIKKLREALGDQAENPRFIETLHRRGYRFIAPVDGNGTSAASASVESALIKKAGAEPRPTWWSAGRHCAWPRCSGPAAHALGLRLRISLVNQERHSADSILGCSATTEPLCRPRTGILLGRPDGCAHHGSRPDSIVRSDIANFFHAVQGN